MGSLQKIIHFARALPALPVGERLNGLHGDITLNWQLGLVLLVVVASTCYLILRIWRAWSGLAKGCGGGCSCKGEEKKRAGLILPEDLKLRQRQQPGS
jgi:hypothetical protein